MATRITYTNNDCRHVHPEHRQFVAAAMVLLDGRLDRIDYETHLVPLAHLFRKMWRRSSRKSRDLSCRLLLWMRGCRGGMGFRQGTKELINWLATDAKDGRTVLGEYLFHIPEHGRWDDLTALFHTPLERDAAKIWAGAIAKKNPLACKWAKCSMVPLQRATRGNEAKLRKLLRAGKPKDMPEELMCTDRWHEIDYETLSHRQLTMYREAFQRHDPARYEAFLQKRTNAKAATGEPARGRAPMHTSPILTSLFSEGEIAALGFHRESPTDNKGEFINNLVAEPGRAGRWNEIASFRSNSMVHSMAELAGKIDALADGQDISGVFDSGQSDSVRKLLERLRDRAKKSGDYALVDFCENALRIVRPLTYSS